MTTIFAAYVFSSLLIAALSIPMILRKIPPNNWYGFRVPKTLNNPHIWYPANAYAGLCLFWASILSFVVTVTLYFVPNLSLETYAISCAVITIMGLVVAVVMSFRYLSKLS